MTKMANEVTCIRPEKSFEIHISVYMMIKAITMVMGQDWEDKCEVVGHGPFAPQSIYCA